MKHNTSLKPNHRQTFILNNGLFIEVYTYNIHYLSEVYLYVLSNAEVKNLHDKSTTVVYGVIRFYSKDVVCICE